MSGKPRFEVELVAYFEGNNVTLVPRSELKNAQVAQAIEKCSIVEVVIPYHTEEAIYGYTIWLPHRTEAEATVVDIQRLRTIAERIHQKFSRLAEPFDP